MIFQQAFSFSQLLALERFLQLVHKVEFLPTEELHVFVCLAFFDIGGFILIEHLDGFDHRLTAEVAIRSRLLEDGVGETEAFYDKVGSQVDEFLHLEGTKAWSQTPAATRFLAMWRAAYAAERSTFELSLPEKAPPPWAPRPP